MKLVMSHFIVAIITYMQPSSSIASDDKIDDSSHNGNVVISKNIDVTGNKWDREEKIFS